MPPFIATMTSPLNGYRGADNTTRTATPANHTLRHLPGRPAPVRSTSEGRLDMGHDRSQVANHVNRRSGGYYTPENGFGHPSDMEHRATWAASEHTWEQGYQVARATDQPAHGGADLRSNRLRDAQWQTGAQLTNGSLGTRPVTNGPRTPADAPLTDESAFRTNKCAFNGHAPSANPLPLPFNHGILFTVDGLMDHTEEVVDDTLPVTPNGPRKYQLPALGSFGDFQIQNHPFTLPNVFPIPKGSPTDSSSPTPTATTFAESHQRTIANELRKLDPAAQRHVAQAVINANAHTKEMLAGTNELLGLLTKLRKDPSAPRFMAAYQQPSPAVAHLPALGHPSSIHSVRPSLSRSASVHTIRSMIHQATASRRATMLLTTTAPNSDDSDDGGATTDDMATETDDTHTTETEFSLAAAPQRPEVRYSEERALAPLLQLIEEHGIRQPQIEAFWQHMPGLASTSRLPSSMRRSLLHRAHSKSRRSKKKRRSKKDKEREQGPLLPPVSGSKSDGLSFDVWEDVGRVDTSECDFMADIMDVAKWYNLHDVVDEAV
ncbi:hypothetical protein CspeluHIS016_0209590 [Cutaneotrichosporon spelunceum]|uniref:Uncharacterized protein n=1 Tax=Cutaneotrichosporon spelunceum TaxID=1672016 RepID=A0AAD3TS18_9TREE|nr:hypothetical protein CspeluHIS016_0209590 [Cutaneotrichosporon spelunceum]